MLGEVHTAEEGLEAGVGAKGIERKPPVDERLNRPGFVREDPLGGTERLETLQDLAVVTEKDAGQ